MGKLACSLDNQPFIVPFNFVFDGKRNLYAFSTLGKKIRWMRKNPLVCVETDEVKNQEDWTTLIVFGRYEELPDVPEFESQRIYAHELLSRRPMWWQPGYAAGTHRETEGKKPVYFRIEIEKITGHRAVTENSEIFIKPGQPAELYKNHRRGFW